ncbi:MAG: O-antigen ligase family protein [Nostocaceae cyanobacterium]|nr:O-antigen ligase family protein [Nostocaceae cyanobacterium]
MLNITSSTPNSTKRDFKLGKLSFAERVIYWTIVLTPLWWLLGIQTLFYPAVAAFLLVIGFELDKIIKASLPICCWAWLLMTLAALWTNIIGLDKLGFEILKTLATLVTLYKGYFLIFSCLTIPFWHHIRVRVITRAVAWMASGYLVTLAIQLLILFAAGPQGGFLPPLARLVPGNKLSLMVKFATIQPFFGIPLPRTDLYTADPPILGVCALLCFFICWSETNPRLRKFALAGCLATLIISQSRLAWICFPLVFVIIAVFRSGLARQSWLWLATFTSLICAVVGMSLKDLINKPLETFNSARADSSKDREYVVSATIDAWRESPWLGWGIVDKTVTWGNGAFELPLGTFSTYAQVLYLHGIFGFIFFISALASTLYYFWQPALKGSKICQQAFASLVALYILCQATNLSWMAIYFWFFFVWLSAILAEISQEHVHISKWEDLSQIQNPSYLKN